MPGIVASGQNNATNVTVVSVSCPPVGSCGAGGSYGDSSGHQQAFVVGQN